MSIMYRPVLQSTAKGGGKDSSAAPQNDRGAAGKSEYQRAREHFSAFFKTLSAEELEVRRRNLAYAQQAIGDRPGQKSWLAHQSAVYFWAMAQSIELGIARQALQQKQREENQAAQQLRF